MLATSGRSLATLQLTDEWHGGEVPFRPDPGLQFRRIHAEARDQKNESAEALRTIRLRWHRHRARMRVVGANHVQRSTSSLVEDAQVLARIDLIAPDPVF